MDKQIVGYLIVGVGSFLFGIGLRVMTQSKDELPGLVIMVCGIIVFSIGWTL